MCLSSQSSPNGCNSPPHSPEPVCDVQVREARRKRADSGSLPSASLPSSTGGQTPLPPSQRSSHRIWRKPLLHLLHLSKRQTFRPAREEPPSFGLPGRPRSPPELAGSFAARPKVHFYRKLDCFAIGSHQSMLARGTRLRTLVPLPAKPAKVTDPRRTAPGHHDPRDSNSSPQQDETYSAR